MKKAILGNYTPHPGQLAFHKSSANPLIKEILVTASIRSGKTYALIHDIIRYSQNNKTGFGTLCAAPTYSMVLNLLEIPIVKRLKDYGLLKSHSYSQHRSVLKNGNEIYYRTLENPDNSLRGLNISRAYVDEAAFVSDYAIDVLRGRLVTTNGTAIYISTPKGRNNWLYAQYYANPIANAAYHKFSIFDNPIISPDAVQQLLSKYDVRLAKQEIYGEFVDLYTDLVYPSFSDENIIQVVPEDVNPYIYIGLDYNIGINAAVVAKKGQNNVMYIIDEIYGCQTVIDIANEIKSRYGTGVTIIDDASGNARSQQSGKTNREILRQSGLYNIHDAVSNPHIKERTAYLNASFKNALGVNMLKIHKDCTTLITELKTIKYKKSSSDIDNEGNKKGHITDALGYLMYRSTEGILTSTPRRLTEIEAIRKYGVQY